MKKFLIGGLSVMIFTQACNKKHGKNPDSNSGGVSTSDNSNSAATETFEETNFTECEDLTGSFEQRDTENTVSQRLEITHDQCKSLSIASGTEEKTITFYIINNRNESVEISPIEENISNTARGFYSEDNKTLILEGTTETSTDEVVTTKYHVNYYLSSQPCPVPQDSDVSNEEYSIIDYMIDYYYLDDDQTPVPTPSVVPVVYLIEEQKDPTDLTKSLSCSSFVKVK